MTNGELIDILLRNPRDKKIEVNKHVYMGRNPHYPVCFNHSIIKVCENEYKIEIVIQ